MNTYKLNILDEAGAVRTGYQDIVEADSKEEAIADYACYLELKWNIVDATVVCDELEN